MNLRNGRAYMVETQCNTCAYVQKAMVFTGDSDRRFHQMFKLLEKMNGRQVQCDGPQSQDIQHSSPGDPWKAFLSLKGGFGRNGATLLILLMYAIACPFPVADSGFWTVHFP